MKRSITVLVELALHARITAAAGTARQSRSAWMALAAVEKLARVEEARRSEDRRAAIARALESQPARPVEAGKGDAQ